VEAAAAAEALANKAEKLPETEAEMSKVLHDAARDVRAPSTTTVGPASTIAGPDIERRRDNTAKRLQEKMGESLLSGDNQFKAKRYVEEALGNVPRDLAKEYSTGLCRSPDRKHDLWENLKGRLPGILKDWSFTDSYVSNLGLAAALFTGIFGSTDVLSSIFGEDSVAPKSVALVATAVSAALVGSGPLFLILFQCPDMTQTVRGVLIASTVALAGNLGLIGVLGFGLQAVVNLWFAVAAVAVALFVLVYAFISMGTTLRKGSRLPQPAPDSDALKAASLIAAAIMAQGGAAGPTVEEVKAAAEEALQEFPELASAPQPERGRVTAAMP
jgi:hypothetical protein